MLRLVAVNTKSSHTEILNFRIHTVTSSVSLSGRSPVTLAAGFLGAFVVASLAVQLVRSQTATVQAGAASVEPVIASPATLWASLGERDAVSVAAAPAAPANRTAAIDVEPVVGSEATLWSSLGQR